MLNIFYLYALVWSFIFAFYLLNWSDLCEKLNFILILFLIYVIILSCVLGYRSKNFKENKNIHLKKNYSRKTTFVILIFFVIEFVINRKIPLIDVILGFSYQDTEFYTIPIIHNFFSAYAIFYSIYIVYYYAHTKEKRLIVDYVLLVCVFALLVQRQYVFIDVVLMMYLLFSLNISRKKIFTNVKSIVLTFVTLLGVLYIFGIAGNARYGNLWKWSDSSMIMKLGKINNNFPSFIPEPYAWSYIYIVSPLANLNYNISIKNKSFSILGWLGEYVPQFIKMRVPIFPKADLKLQVNSLNVLTEFAGSYYFAGFLGIFMIVTVHLGICYFILKQAYRRKNEIYCIINTAMFYYLVLSVFDNSFIFSITSLIAIYSMFCVGKYKFCYRGTNGKKTVGLLPDMRENK